MSDTVALETYLHEHIPLSAAMQVRVVAASEATIVLEAPLAPNINHRQTVFGGSLSTLATLAAWALVHTRLTTDGRPSRVVIQSGTTDYLAPALGAFTATCVAPSASEWERFVRVLVRRGKARLTLTSDVHSDGILVATFTGAFVAIDLEAA